MSILFVLFLCNIFFSTFIQGEKQVIKVGGIFDQYDDRDQDLVFQYSVEGINEEEMLPRHRLVAKTARVPFEDSLAVNEAVCAMIKDGVLGILGPTSEPSSYHVQSICDEKQIPRIVTSLHTAPKNSTFHLDLYQPPDELAKLFMDLIKTFKWRSFTILYQESHSFARLSELISLSKNNVIVNQLDLGHGNNFRAILQEAKRSGETNFVLDCSADILTEILFQAQQVGLLSNQHDYIITTPDLHTKNLEPFLYGGTKFTGIKYVDDSNANTIEILQNWSRMYRKNYQDPSRNTPDYFSVEKLKTSSALIHDAVRVFASGIKTLNPSVLKVNSLSCDRKSIWGYGTDMIDILKKNKLKGLTKNIEFDNFGKRSDFSVEIISVNSNGFVKMATWYSSQDKNKHFKRNFLIPEPLTKLNLPVLAEMNQPSINRKRASIQDTLKVLVVLNAPFVMRKDGTSFDQFEGYCIDLIEELSKLIGFKYTVTLQRDYFYGHLDSSNGKWSGMIGELVEGRADLALSDMTITTERISAVDFSLPFMEAAVGVMISKPVLQLHSKFQFLAPFSTQVWIWIVVSYILVSVALFICSRIASKEWHNPDPCDENPKRLKNDFGLINSIWFITGGLFQQGSGIAPRSLSTRLIAAVWWFFACIILAHYVAYLINMSLEYRVPVSSLKDLVNNKDGIAYGAKTGGSTYAYLKNSNNELHKQMYLHMTSHPEALYHTNNEAVERVKSGKYAFMMETPAIEYLKEQDCRLAMLDETFNERFYGIAMKKDSVYRNEISSGIMQLKEMGKLDELKRKWWVYKNKKTAECEDDTNGPTELQMSNIDGLFWVLLIGCVIAFIIAICEMVKGSKKRAQQQNVPFQQALVAELRSVTKSNNKNIDTVIDNNAS